MGGKDSQELSKTFPSEETRFGVSTKNTTSTKESAAENGRESAEDLCRFLSLRRIMSGE